MKEGITMAFSEFLNSRREAARSLVKLLREQYAYVSVLGVDIKTKSIRVDRNTSNIAPGYDTECGFVVKMCNGGAIFEYSLDDIVAEDMGQLAATISKAFRLQEKLTDKVITGTTFPDEPLVQSFSRENDLAAFSEQQLLDFCRQQKDALLAESENVLNAVVILGSFEVSKLFVTPNRELDQNYAWINGTTWVVYKENDKVVQSFEGAASHRMADVLEELPAATASHAYMPGCGVLDTL